MRIIAGELRSRRLNTPDNDKTRPTTDRSRESLFNVLDNLIEIENARVLDLFAGSGAVAFEALSRGAKEAVLVEKDRHALEAIRRNIDDLELKDQVRVVSKDAYASIPLLNGDFDFIFADAPYRDLKSMKELPGLLLGSSLLRPNAIIVIEHSVHNKMELPEEAELIKSLTVGDAAFTIFTKSGGNGEKAGTKAAE